jgi:hypothetical protein
LTASITAADISTGGSIPISVIAGPGGIVSNIVNFTVNNPGPQITGITPSPVSVSGPAFTLTVNGTGFVPNSVVRINGDLPANERQTVFVNATQLTASITAADIAATGAFPITVFNPLPSGGLSNAVNLTVNDPLPTITSLSPASVTAGAVDFPLAVNGSNFVTGAVVRLNGTDATTTFVSATQLTTTVPAASVANAGTLNVTVRNPSGGTSLPAPLAISNPVPILTSLSPASKTAGDAGFTLIANGSNFNTTSVLRINGTDRVTTLVSATQLSTPLTALDIATAGNRTVTVFNPAPGGGTSSSVDLVVNNPLPTITNLTPNNLLQGAPQTIVAITGTGFVNGSVVSWKGQNRTTSFVSATQLNAEITANDLNVSGPANITVANPSPGGGTSNAMAFTVNANPRILRVLDASGFAGGSATVTVQLAAQGDENALGFTLYFDPAVLSNPIASLGPDASAATLNGNSSQVAQGHYGVVLSLPAGMTFSPGTKNVATVTFSVASVPSGTLTQVSFGDLPVTREVADIVAEVLPTAYVAGTLTLTTGVESDVAPRPNGSGSGTVTVSDWVQVGRFVSGVDSTSSSAEFQRADCAPRASLGNGSMTVSDWVQAGRYAAGLDPVVPAGGPNSPPAGAPDSKDFESAQGGSGDVAASSQARAVRLNLLEQVGQERIVAISLDAFGAENGVGFSLMFDPSKLEFVSATNGADAQAATLQVNQASASRGRLGFALALPTGQSFREGTHQVVVLRFVAFDRVSGRADLNFTDFPVTRELVAENASILKVDFQDIPGRESNPIDDQQYFVYRQYVDLLGRQPDAGGLDYWTSQIAACGSDELCINRRRVAVSDAFLFEREFHETGAFIIRAYKAALGVTPTFQQFSQDREGVVGGLAINENKGRFAGQLTDSAAFSRLYPATMNPARYVEALDLNAGRVLNDLQKQELTRSLAAGRDTRASVLLRIAELPTFADREYNSAFVLMQYFGYLQRDPDPEGFRFWLGQLDRFALRDVSAQHGLVCSFITSSEYQSRFGSQISRSNADCGR